MLSYLDEFHFFETLIEIIITSSVMESNICRAYYVYSQIFQLDE